LARLLRPASVELQTFRGRLDGPAISRFAMEARGAPVIVIDDAHTLPLKAPWLAELVKASSDFAPSRQPRVVYLTHRSTAAGFAQAAQHPLIKRYINRDDGNQWVTDAAQAVLVLVEQMKAETAAVAPAATPSSTPEIIGASPCFREAVEDLGRLLDAPYGLVTGPAGVGKLFLIRTLWQQVAGRKRVIIVACGSFFKDYYIGGSHRRLAPGREAIDQLTPFLSEAADGLLILHHVEQLPVAVQEEVATRIDFSSGGKGRAVRFLCFDQAGLVEHDVKLLATSTCNPELWLKRGRLIPDLARHLSRHQVKIPSLAARGPEDLKLLCEAFLDRLARMEGLPAAPHLDDAAFGVLAREAWPNNLSDLMRVLEWAVHAAKGGTIRRQHLPKDLLSTTRGDGPLSLKEITAQAQRAAIQNVLQQSGENVRDAAELLALDKGSLYRTMKRLGMPVARDRCQG
jgi:DNA-binding NtrC family response regulator